MKAQAMAGEIFTLDELVHDAEPTPSAWRDDPSRQAVDRGMTILSECLLDAGTPDDPVEAQVESLAQLILTSANPAETAARIRGLLQSRLDDPSSPTGRP